MSAGFRGRCRTQHLETIRTYLRLGPCLCGNFLAICRRVYSMCSRSRFRRQSRCRLLLSQSPFIVVGVGIEGGLVAGEGWVRGRSGAGRAVRGARTIARPNRAGLGSQRFLGRGNLPFAIQSDATRPKSLRRPPLTTDSNSA